MKNSIIIFVIIFVSLILASSFAMEMLKEQEEMARYYAALALGNIGDKRAVKPLIAALKDKDPFVRKYAIQALGKIGDKSAIEPLKESLYDYCLENRLDSALALEKLGWKPKNGKESLYLNWAKKKWEDIEDTELLILELKDENRAVRRGAAEVLSKISKKGDRRALFSLIFALKDTDWAVPIYAAEALGNIGDTQAVESLIVALKDNDSRVREKVAEALGKIKDRRAIKPLIEILLKDNDSDVRMHAAIALEKLDWRPKNDEEKLCFLLAKKDWAEIKKTDLIKNLILMVKSERLDRWKKGKIIEILGEIGDVRAVEPLIELMKVSGNYWEPVVALGKIKDKKAIEPLIEALQNKDSTPGDRCRIIEALGEINDSGTKIYLMPFVKDKDIAVRTVTIKALSRMGTKEAIEPLVNDLIDPYLGGYTSEGKWGIRNGTATALEELGWKPQNDNEERHFLFAKAMSKKYKEGRTEKELTKDHTVIDKLKEKKVIAYFLRDEDEYSRERAAELAGILKLKDEEVIELLIRALGDESNRVQRAAANALKIIGDTKGLDALVECLKDFSVSSIAVRALVEIKDKRVADFLINELERIRKEDLLGAGFSDYEIVIMLGQIGDKRAVEPLIQILKTKPKLNDKYYFSEW